MRRCRDGAGRGGGAPLRSAPRFLLWTFRMFQVHSTTAGTFDAPFFFIASPYIAHCVCPPAGDVPLVSFRAMLPPTGMAVEAMRRCRDAAGRGGGVLLETRRRKTPRPTRLHRTPASEPRVTSWSGKSCNENTDRYLEPKATTWLWLSCCLI